MMGYLGLLLLCLVVIAFVPRYRAPSVTDRRQLRETI
jgi:hypothetical protein